MSDIESLFNYGVPTAVLGAGGYAVYKLASRLIEHRMETEKEAIKSQADFVSLLSSLKDLVNNSVIGQNNLINQGQISVEQLQRFSEYLKDYSVKLQDISSKIDSLLTKSKVEDLQEKVETILDKIDE